MIKNNDPLHLIDLILVKKPFESKLYNTKGYILVNQNELKKAIKCFAKAIQLDPNEPEFYKNKGFLLTKFKKYKKANKYFDKAIKLCPQNEDYVLFKRMNSIEEQFFEIQKRLEYLKDLEEVLVEQKEEAINTIGYRNN